MAIVLNTDEIDPRDRADMMATVLQEISAPAHMVHRPENGPVQAYLEAWEFGQIGLHRMRMSGFNTVRTRKQIQASTASLLTLSVQREKSARLVQAGIEQETSPGDMFAVNLDIPYELEWRAGKVTMLTVPIDRLGVSSETIGTALGRLRSSPLYPMIVNHVVMMDESAELLHNDVVSKELGDACIDLIRTLFVSAAAQGAEDGTALPADFLLAQIRSFVRRRLANPDLNAPTIARAHHISVRYLYKLCARAGISLEQWIITERLERVRGDLARPDSRNLSISVIAHRHGFRDPSHLNRRFRAAYGMTPRDWRRTALEPVGLQDL